MGCFSDGWQCSMALHVLTTSVLVYNVDLLFGGMIADWLILPRFTAVSIVETPVHHVRFSW